MVQRGLVIVAALMLGALAIPARVEGPPAKLPRIGVLQPGTGVAAGHFFEAFKDGMREQGYAESRTVVYERRFGDLKPERLSAAAAELVRLKVDLIVTSTDVGIAAVRQQT